MVPKKDVTVFSDSMIRFIVPKVFTGEVNLNGRIEVKTDHGSFTGSTLFNYNPALNGVASLTPGGSIDTTVTQTASSTSSPNNLTGTNPNPQDKKPITLIETVNTKTSNGSTDTLTVRVNPAAGAWRIDTVPSYNDRIVSLKPGPNNTYIEDTISVSYGGGGRLSGYVSADQQEFSITKQDIIDDLGLSSYSERDLKAYVEINLYARPVDKTINPQDVSLSYNFNAFQTTKKVGDPVIVSETKVESITFLGEGVNLQGTGPQYYNVVKLGGGWKSFQFNVPTYNPQDLVSQSVVDMNNTTVSATFTEGSDTKYTYKCTVNSIGTFRLKLKYKVNGVETTVLGPSFTL